MGPALALAPATAALAAVSTAVSVVDPVAERALGALRDDASGGLVVSRDESGSVEAVVSRSGEAVLASGERSPAAAAEEQLGEYGAAFGIDGSTSEAVVTQTLPSATGGTIVRAQQTIDGVEVFGGQVVTTLDAGADLVSVSADTVRDAETVEVSAPRLSADAAGRIAVQATARARSVPGSDLSATVQGRRLYDPALVGLADQPGVRSVWEIEVRDGATVRETVLVGTDRGEVALRFDSAPAATDRWICDNARDRSQADDDAVGVCASPARVEGGDPTLVEEVDDAYDHVGETSAAYEELAGVDLTELVGVAPVTGQQKRLVATVNWCVSDRSCPYANAFWDGRQIVLGEGLAGADDVVAHELTHGYVERTSNLFYFQQSGAINESFADVIGEIVDRRTGDEDTGWTVGEDVEGPLEGLVLRTISDPTQQRMPDRMSSDLWQVQDWDAGDRGAVHHNLGVGNKTAYLISQGGDFNGRTIEGIDEGDPMLAKTGLLYLETIPRLTSGAQYADVGRVLAATCDELAAAPAGALDEADCDAVRDATAATELDQPPADPRGALGEAARSCPTETSEGLLERDDDGLDGFAWSTTPELWFRTEDGIPPYARSGESSLFGFNPDPTNEYADPQVSTATSKPLAVPQTVGGVFFHFHHAFALDHVDETFYDGATVRVERQVGSEWAPVTMPESAWVNGPDKQIVGRDGFTGFGGDSKGWGSSRLDLTPLAGETVRLVLHIEADPEIAALGWWLDDLRLYACDGVSPPAPSAVSAQVSATNVTLRWQPPTAGAAPAAYDVARSDKPTVRVPASARSIVLSGFAGTTDAEVSVAAVAAGGAVGTAASRRVEATTSTTAAPARVRRGQRFAVTGRVVQRGSTVGVRGVTMTLQRRLAGTSRWVKVASGPTAVNGTRRWTVSQRKPTAYRVVVTSGGLAFGSTSGVRTVRMR